MVSLELFWWNQDQLDNQDVQTLKGKMYIFVQEEVPFIYLLQNNRNQDRSQHQEDSVIPTMLFCDKQLNTQHILETPKTCCEKGRDNQRNQQPFFQWRHQKRIYIFTRSSS